MSLTRLSAIVLLVIATIAAANDELDSRFNKEVLIIVASAHACHRFDVYLALDDEQRRRGLMFVRDLPQMTGMLFVYAESSVHSMWMKNTYIPLDMIFARADGSVSSVVRQTEPQSLRSIASIEPVNYVLELNSGVTKRLSIDKNSRLILEKTWIDDE